ncbi:MAG: tRNA threonylcarbamoyladenosine biosynthesis protein TsaE [Patescibacteria group bacterium]|jgi:tRNA threonylcarbamoyladenosine biosynthesis protein TsaE|nr:tRNA threonylcarbamoyladenosine biosynthesis protein TsaE [Patescibacteria group bacterium]
MEYVSGSEVETRDIAKIIVQKIIDGQNKGPLFVGLVGDLGAGKTSFTKGVAEFFGIENTIVSPTFVIQKVYEIKEENRKEKNHSFKKLVHIDMYRLEDESELSTIDWNNYKNNSDNIIFVEWPNQIFKENPEEMITIKIEHLGLNERKIIYVSGERRKIMNDQIN